MDVRTVFPDPRNPPYAPENYDRKYHGPQTLRQALQRSYNIPAVWLMHQVGVRNVIKTARQLGVNSLNRELNSYGLSLTLGGGEVALFDHTYAFSVFANGGVMAGQPGARRSASAPAIASWIRSTSCRCRTKMATVLDEYRQPEHRAGGEAGRQLHAGQRADGSRAALRRLRRNIAVPRAARPAGGAPKPARLTVSWMAGPSASRRSWPSACGRATATTSR